MTPCVGWPADPPCGVYGDMHGCKLPDGHNHLAHVCACGERIRAHRPRKPRSQAGRGAVLRLGNDGRFVTVDTYDLRVDEGAA